jgi:hypothetical protein
VENKMATCQVKHPKNRKTSSTVGNGIRQNNVDPGNRTVILKNILECSWSKNEFLVGESIDANIVTSGFPDGTKINVTIFQSEANCPDWKWDFPATLNGNKAKLTWKYPEKLAPGDIPTHRSQPRIYFGASVEDFRNASSDIPIYSNLNIKVIREDGTGIPDEKVEITQSNGHLKIHQTDKDGKVTVKKVWPGYHKIKFPNSPRILPDQIITGLNPAAEELIVKALGSEVAVFKLIETYVYCSHKSEGQRRSAGNTKFFEVVPDSIGKDAYKDEVMILSRTATSLQADNRTLEKKQNEFGMKAFALKCDQDFEYIPNIFDLDFWKGLVVPKQYPISGLPSPLTIKCYRPDLYKFQIKFPSFRKWSGGTKIEAGRGRVENKTKQKPPIVVEHCHNPTKKEGWHLNKWPMPMSSEAPIIVQRNGANITTSFMKSVGAVIELSEKLTEIISAIQKNVPKAGVYFEWENQFLQGTFVVEWGWKEYKDHRAYYYVGANIDIKLIDFKFEIGVGLSGFSFKIQAFGAITGGVTLSVKLCRYSPDGEAEISLPFSAEIIGALGARVEVGCFVKIEGTVETGIKLEDGALKFRQNEGWSIGCALKWAGLVGKLKVSGGTAKKEGGEEHSAKAEVSGAGENEDKPKEMDEKASHSFEHELIGSKDLGKWEWSSKHKAEYNPPVISSKDLQEMLVDKLKVGPKIRVLEKAGILNDYVDLEKLAQVIGRKIQARKDIRQDPRSIEAMTCEIRQDLEATMMRRYHGLTPYLEQSQFDTFVNGDDLQIILDRNTDPMKEVINKNPDPT